MPIHSKIENLLESQILRVLRDWLRPIRSGDITRELNKKTNSNLRSSSVNSALERLEKKGYVKWERYGLVELTDFGKKEAIALTRHHRLLEVLLVKELGLSKEQAHKEADSIFPPLTCDTINLICQKYEHPNKCPCGHIIEHSDNCGCFD